MSDEFDIIRRLFAPLSSGAPGAFKLTDDAAALPLDAGFEHIVTTDTVVEGVHFLADATPEHTAAKLVGSNLSDLAAMGATPVGFTLSCGWRQGTDESWMAAFAASLGTWIDRFAFPLLGGDTVSVPGPAVFTLTAIGRVAAGKALRRNGAKPGDTVYVTGSIGDGALGLLVAQGELGKLAQADAAFLIDRYLRPQPRISTGERLVGHASSAIDISDGLLQDAGHIAETSGVDIVIEAARIPLSAAAKAALEADGALLRLVLGGGDDYELLFTSAAAAPALDLPVTAIGRVEAGAGRVTVRDENGAPLQTGQGGYRHFS
jgi:thiamine-monophosphate kinase